MTEEMAQSVMYLPDKHADLSLDAQHPHKNQTKGGATHACNSSAGEAETGRSMRLTDLSSQAVSSGSMTDPITKTKLEKN